MDADEIIARLKLSPHPEGGYFRETFRDDVRLAEGRAASTAIYYLLKAGQSSWWHRVDASEVWHWYAGGAIRLTIGPSDETGYADEARQKALILGNDIEKGEAPQIVVPAGCWQKAEPVDGWVLVGCTVAPGFEFSTFEMAPRP